MEDIVSINYRVTVLIGEGMTNVESTNFIDLILDLIKIFKKHDDASIIDATAFHEKESYNIKQKVIQTLNERREDD